MNKERKRKEKTTNKGEKKKKRTQQRQVEKGIGRIKHSSVTKSTLPSCMVMVSKNMKKITMLPKHYRSQLYLNHGMYATSYFVLQCINHRTVNWQALLSWLQLYFCVYVNACAKIKRNCFVASFAGF